MPTIVQLEESEQRALRVIELQNRELKAKMDLLNTKLDEMESRLNIKLNRILSDVETSTVLTTDIKLGTPVKQ